jgi:hypothetical protein
MNQALIGLIMVTFAAFLNSFVYILWKKAHTKSEVESCNYLLTKEYIWGMILLVLA